MLKRLVAGLVVVAVLACAGCGGSAGGLTGLGAGERTFHAHHPQGYSSVVADDRGRVTAYILTSVPRSLAAATAAVRRDLPADATAGAPRTAVGVESTACAVVTFRSARLGRTLGSSQVTAEFMSATATRLDPAAVISAVVRSGPSSISTGC